MAGRRGFGSGHFGFMFFKVGYMILSILDFRFCRFQTLQVLGYRVLVLMGWVQVGWVLGNIRSTILLSNISLF